MRTHKARPFSNAGIAKTCGPETDRRTVDPGIRRAKNGIKDGTRRSPPAPCHLIGRGVSHRAIPPLAGKNQSPAARKIETPPPTPPDPRPAPTAESPPPPSTPENPCARGHAPNPPPVSRRHFRGNARGHRHTPPPRARHSPPRRRGTSERAARSRAGWRRRISTRQNWQEDPGLSTRLSFPPPRSNSGRHRKTPARDPDS